MPNLCLPPPGFITGFDLPEMGAVSRLTFWGLVCLPPVRASRVKYDREKQAGVHAPRQ